MELLVAFGALVAFALLALRFAHDSSGRLISAEERFAARGFSWGPEAEAPTRVSPVLTAARSARARLGRSLGSLPARLRIEPDPSDAAWPGLHDYPFGRMSG